VSHKYIFTQVAFCTLCVGFGLLAIAGDPEVPSSKSKSDQIEKKFYRCWLETERVTAGVSSKDPFELVGIEYSKNGTWSWGRRGELSTGLGMPAVNIDTTSDPMRFEYLGLGEKAAPMQVSKRKIKPGIFKFEGDNLVVIVNEWMFDKVLEKGKDYAERPTEFKSTKENKWTLSIMKPAEYLAQD
jgi:hypothetical protein